MSLFDDKTEIFALNKLKNVFNYVYYDSLDMTEQVIDLIIAL